LTPESPHTDLARSFVLALDSCSIEGRNGMLRKRVIKEHVARRWRIAQERLIKSVQLDPRIAPMLLSCESELEQLISDLDQLAPRPHAEGLDS
jgi:hypothetical protein